MPLSSSSTTDCVEKGLHSSSVHSFPSTSNGFIFMEEEIETQQKAEIDFFGRTMKRKERRTFWKVLKGHRQALLIWLCPLLLSPLLFNDEQEYKCAFCVCLMAAYWTIEVMPLAITALLPTVLFPVMGILSSKDVAREFLNDTNFLFIGGLIIAAAVEKCGLHERVALGVLSLVGSKPHFIMLGFMLITAALSMFISNTATVAMMLPIGQSVILQFSSNSLDSNTNGHSRTGLNGSGSLLKMESAGGQNGSANGHKEAVMKRLRAGTEVNSRMAKGLILSIAFAANIGGVGTLTGTPPNLVLVGMLSSLFPDADTGINYLSWMAMTVPLMFCCLITCWLLLSLIFLRNASSSPEADKHIAAMMRQRGREQPPMSFAQKSVAVCFVALLLLWVCRDPGFMPGFSSLFLRDFFSDATSAMAVAILLFLLPAQNPFRRSKNIQTASKDEKRLMDWPTMQKQFPWSVVLLLGGGFALAAGVRQSGLSRLMAAALGELDSHSSWALQLSCVVLIMMVTNICSNAVTASIFIPIVSSLAQRAQMHPLALMLPTTLACSFAFVLPVGTPPNAIAFSSGLIRVTDMVLSGLAVSASTAAITIAYLAFAAPFIMPIDKFPDWAALPISTNNNGTNDGFAMLRILEPEMPQAML